MATVPQRIILFTYRSANSIFVINFFQQLVQYNINVFFTIVNENFNVYDEHKRKKKKKKEIETKMKDELFDRLRLLTNFSLRFAFRFFLFILNFFIDICFQLFSIIKSL